MRSSSCSITARTCADIDFFKTKAIPTGWLFYCPVRGRKERNLDILNKGKPTHRHARIPRRIRTLLAALADRKSVV